MKSCSTSLIIREIPIKTIVRYHFTPVRMAIIKKTTIRRIGKTVEKRGHFGTVGGNSNWQQNLWKTELSLLKKLKIELPYDPAIPLLGVYPKELKSGSHRDICTPCSLQHYPQ